MTNEREFIRFVGKLVFEPEHCGWSDLSAVRQREFCEQAGQAGLETLFLLALGKQLFDDVYEAFCQVYRRESMIRLIEKSGLMAFMRQWDERKIPLVPLKGADLAFRIYPDPALRPHCDWDILFREDDCMTVIRTLMDQGWQTFSGHSLEELESYGHHYERMHDDRNSIEVHRTLPHFGTATPDEIWAETVTDASGQRHLTPEVNLLLVCAHATVQDFGHVSQWRLLLDAGYILRHDAVDWTRVRALAERWNIISPVLLFSFWSDFFPDGMLPLEEVDAEQRQALQTVFGMRRQVAQATTYDKLSVPARYGFWTWFKARMSFYCGSRWICKKYHLERHQIFRICAWGLWDFGWKVCYFCTHCWSRQGRFLRRYQHAMDRVEQRRK